MPVIFRKYYIYTVVPGDTVYAIAQRYNSSVGEIIRVNHLHPPIVDTGMIFPGDILLVPDLVSTGNVSLIVPSGDTLGNIAYRYSTYTDLLAGINQIENPSLIYAAQQITLPAMIYEVKTDDSIYKLASDYGLSPLSIIRANERRPGFQPDLIWPGYHLLVPLPTMRNMVVWSPLPGTKINNGFNLKGQARSFEANVLYRLLDSNGVTVADERFTTADMGAPYYGNFSASVPFDRHPTSAKGELWVYTRSAKDGSIQDLLRIRIYF